MDVFLQYFLVRWVSVFVLKFLKGLGFFAWPWHQWYCFNSFACMFVAMVPRLECSWSCRDNLGIAHITFLSPFTSTMKLPKLMWSSRMFLVHMATHQDIRCMNPNYRVWISMDKRPTLGTSYACYLTKKVFVHMKHLFMHSHMIN